MITPSYSLTATERVLPRLALDFTTANLDPRVTFTRSGDTATVTNLSGVIVGINANLPRFDFDPITLACRGLLIEESRTNVLLNSLIDGTNLVTQVVAVTAAARTLSFYGTGTIVLSGAASATLTGTGAYPARTTLTFTPSAGALTLTVTGTVQFAQLEAGAFATSYIPTTTTAVTRNADVATMTGTNFSDWYNATQGSIVLTLPSLSVKGTTDCVIGEIFNSSANIDRRSVFLEAATGSIINRTVNNAATTVNLTTTSATSTTAVKFAYSWNTIATTLATAYKGSSLKTSASGPTPTSLNTFNIGASRTNAAFLNQWISGIYFYPQTLTNAELIAFSK